MDILFKPRLRHCTLIDEPESGKTTLVVGTHHFELERTAGARDEFLKLKSLLDGRRSIRDISSRTGVPLDDVMGVVAAFDGAGLLQQRTAADRIDAHEFKARVEDSSLMWRRQIGLHPLFAGLSERRFRREVFIGLLIETWHYVKALPRLLKRLSAGMKDHRFRNVVAHYAEEEMDHHRLYEASLKTIDIVGSHLDEAHPTVGTLSLLRNFESIGLRNELSLVCCLQLIEARQSEMDSAESHLLTIARNYKLEDAVRPYIEHMKADVDMGHSGLLETALGDIADIAASQAHDAVNDMHDLKHAFDGFHNGVIEYYADISNYIPRPRVDYFAL